MALGGCPSLTRLNLDGTRITDAGMPAVRKLGKLESLTILDTHVTDRGIEHIMGMRGLEATLGTTVTPEGVQRLTESGVKAWGGPTVEGVPFR
jgi:hypothetical protein